MKKPKITGFFSAILIFLCSLLFFSSCSSAVKFNKNGYSGCTYNENSYISMDVSPGTLCWYPLPSMDSIKKIDDYPIWPICVISGDPIYATSEESPYFLIIDLRGENEMELEQSSISVMIREDIKLTSVYDTPYQKIVAEYDEAVQDEEKYFSNYPSGMTYKDLIGNSEGISSKDLNNLYYYCTLYCSYPNIDYLVCELLIWKEEITGRFYFQTFEDSGRERIMYPINMEQGSE